eukprot:CAMPEP_0171398508 /NCGR_PEP_ID=MMETSP0880-20121228/5983_1 /TAXON_ID=67004 /ORGANISM="Thalassiosira weissflogii, Strain CCMP1336" /LENGTH=38 /DNA_ID= /DNA_START= /DNA_END= /DNA_ORIENTATION=
MTATEITRGMLRQYFLYFRSSKELASTDIAAENTSPMD